MKETKLRGEITVAGAARVVAIAITMLMPMYQGDQAKALAAIAAYFGYRIEKVS